MKYWFTFEEGQAHLIDGFLYNKDVIVEIEEETVAEATKKIISMFGDNWTGISYRQPNFNLFPRGVKKLKIK